MRDSRVESRTTESISAPPTRRQPWSLDRRLARRAEAPGGTCATPQARPRHDRAHRASTSERRTALTRSGNAAGAHTTKRLSLQQSWLRPRARTPSRRVRHSQPEPTGSVRIPEVPAPSHSSPRKRSSVTTGVSTVTYVPDRRGATKSAGVGRLPAIGGMRRRSRATEAAARRSRGVGRSRMARRHRVSGARSAPRRRPCPHQRHATSSVRSLSTTSSSTTRSPPPEVRNWRVVRVEVTSKRSGCRMRCSVAGRGSSPTVLGRPGRSTSKPAQQLCLFVSNSCVTIPARSRRGDQLLGDAAAVAVAPAACWKPCGASPSPGAIRVPILIVGRLRVGAARHVELMVEHPLESAGWRTSSMAIDSSPAISITTPRCRAPVGRCSGDVDSAIRTSRIWTRSRTSSPRRSTTVTSSPRAPRSQRASARQPRQAAPPRASTQSSAIG